MKNIIKILLILFISFILNSCSTYSKLDGKWNVCELLIQNKSELVYKSNISFTKRNKEIIANGYAGVNLFKCKIEIKNKLFNASQMTNTGFNGLADNMRYENLFFTTLMNGTNYKVKDNKLYIYAPSKEMILILDKITNEASE